MSNLTDILAPDDENVEEEAQYHVYGRIQVWATVDRIVSGFRSELRAGGSGDPIEEAIREEIGDMGVDRECAQWVTPADGIIAIPIEEREGPPMKGTRFPSVVYHPLADCNVCHHAAHTKPEGCTCQCHELYPPLDSVPTSE